AGVEIEGLPQKDVDAAKPLADGRGDGGFKGHLVLLDRFEDSFGDLPLFFNDFDAAFLNVPGDLDAGCVDAPAGRLGDLGPHAVATNECDVIHARLGM